MFLFDAIKNRSILAKLIGSISQKTNFKSIYSLHYTILYLRTFHFSWTKRSCNLWNIWLLSGSTEMTFEESLSMAFSYWYHRRWLWLLYPFNGMADMRGGIVSARKLDFRLFTFKHWSSICCWRNYFTHSFAFLPCWHCHVWNKKEDLCGLTPVLHQRSQLKLPWPENQKD